MSEEPRGKYLAQLLDGLAAHKSDQINIIETGCVRGLGENYRMGDGHSTLYLAGWAKEHQSAFFSIEISPAAIYTARELLREQDLEPWASFIQGDGVEVLSRWSDPLDFAFLDSGPDQILNLTEFWLAHSRLRKPSFIVIDDCFGLPDSETKGRLALESVTRIGLAPIFRLDRMAVIPFGREAEDVVQNIGR